MIPELYFLRCCGPSGTGSQLTTAPVKFLKVIENHLMALHTELEIALEASRVRY
jgi:hypothetical protein